MMNEQDNKTLQGWTASFAETADGAWLKTFNWTKIPVDWSGRCNAENGILGMYCFGHIYLMDAHDALSMIFPTYIHELYHRYQYISNPVRYLIGKIYRPLIENPADEMTEKSESFIKERQK